MKTRDVINEYARDHLSTIATGVERERQLRRVLAKFENRAFKAITQRELTAELSNWHGPTRNRYRAALTHIFRWARSHGITTLVPTFLGAKETSRDDVISFDHMRALLDVAGKRGTWGNYGRVLILTAQRRGDVMSMLPAHVDKGTWTQPSSKNGTSHLVPLGFSSQDILAKSQVGDRYTWTGKTTYADFKRRWFKDAGVPLTFRLHDFRRAFATHMVEMGWDANVIDRHLNHQAAATSRGVARIYNRATLIKDRRRAAEAWEAMLTW